MKYKYIIFDMDGTLLDTQAALLASIEKGLKEFDLKKSLTREELAASWSGDVLKMLVEFVNENSRTFLKYDDIIFKLTRYYNRELWEREVRPFPGIMEMLTYLKDKNVKLCVFSNSPKEMVEALTDCFFPEIFDMVIGLTEKIKKPDATILKKLFYRYQISQEDVLMVGDTMTDYYTSVNGNVDFLGVTWDCTPYVYQMIQEADKKKITLLNKPADLIEYIL